MVTVQQGDWQKVAAEIVGTFFFFFLAIGSIAYAGDIGLLYIALANGVGLSVVISSLGHISGAHFNPAVTIGMMVVRRISPLLGLLYILAQIAGGVLACLALVAVLPESQWRPFNLGTPGLSPAINTAQGIFLEALLTFFLVIAIFGTVVDTRANRIAGFGIGLTVFVVILVGGPLTGAIMNPARSLAPAIVSGTWNASQLIYWTGPIIGAVVAAVLYTAVFLPKAGDPTIEVPDTTGTTGRTIEPLISEPGLIKDR